MHYLHIATNFSKKKEAIILTKERQRVLIEIRWRLPSLYTKKYARLSPFSLSPSLYKFPFLMERTRWSVTESMRQDRRALSRDNIIILYGHASHARKLRVRAKALWRKKKEVGNRVEVSQWAAGAPRLFAKQLAARFDCGESNKQ